MQDTPDDFCMQSTRALNIKVSGHTKEQVQTLLSQFVRDGWLHESRGYYSLAPRTVLELEQYLKSEFPDNILTCSVCMQIVTKGERCTCGSALHHHCKRRLEHTNLVCPACATPWTTLVVGDERLFQRQERQAARMRESGWRPVKEET
jgi:hypothetical protein